MDSNFTKTELQHIMTTMNGNGSFEGKCEVCASARKKLEAMINSIPDDEPEFFSLDE